MLIELLKAALPLSIAKRKMEGILHVHITSPYYQDFT